MTKIAALLLTGCLLAGCATYADIRAKAPSKTVTIKAPPGVAADCALDKLQLKYASGQAAGSTFQRSQAGGTVHIAAQFNGLFGPQNYSYDLSFVPIEGGMTRVELRTLSESLGQTPPRLMTEISSCP